MESHAWNLIEKTYQASDLMNTGLGSEMIWARQDLPRETYKAFSKN